jgi:lactate dehydrogenase-like 2-hydroxyacid dehydrogenase
MKVLITRKIHPEAVGLLRSRFDIDYQGQNVPLPRQYLIDHIGNYHGILSCVSERFDAGLLERAKLKLKIISNMAAGLDNIDVSTARALGIEVRNTPDVVTECTADFTLAMALSLLRKIPQAHDYVRRDKWTAWDPEIFLGRTLCGLTWGIVGLGKIGLAVARRIIGFGCHIMYFDPYVTLTQLQDGQIELQKTGFRDLLKASDIISVHVPLTAETKYLMDGEALRAMKKTAFLINMARGQVVKSKDLVSALMKKRIAGAALDVFDPEPISGNHDILKFGNIIVTPHIGTATEECRREMAMAAAKNIVDFFKQELKS